MIHYVTYVKDVIGNNFLGINVGDSAIQTHINRMKSILGDEFEEYRENKHRRDRGENHITVINVADYNRCIKKFGMDDFVSSLDKVFKFQIDDLKFMGLGMSERSGNKAFYVVCKSEKLDAIRERYGLRPHDFHVTLGFKWKDVFGVRKNVVLEDKSDFLRIFAQRFFEKENFNFVRQIDNYKGDIDKEIIPISINDKYIKILVGDTVMGIGLIDDKLRVVYSFKKEGDEQKLPLTELIGFIKKNL